MTHKGFKVGDKVVSHVSKPDAPRGALGIIVEARGSKRYIVQFQTALVFMRGSELEHTEEPPPPDRQDTP
jgi:hypothetical protein